MEAKPKVIIYPVKDIASAKSFYSKLLGIDPYVDSAYYVGFKIGDIEIGLDPNDHKEGLTPYFDVSDVKAAVKTMVEAGATLVEDAKDVGGGLLVAKLKDKDGNLVGIRG